MAGAGGKRPGAGRPKGSLGKSKRSDRKMELNNFDQFEKDLIVNYINHRYGEPAIDHRPLFMITVQQSLNMSLIELEKRFGPSARKRLERFFQIEEGKPGTLSRLTLSTGGHNVLLYDWLNEQDLMKLIRTDKIDGCLEAWPASIERMMTLMGQERLAALRTGSSSSGVERASLRARAAERRSAVNTNPTLAQS